MSKKYQLPDWQIEGIANLCYQEQGSGAGAIAEASLMCNLYELRNGGSYGSLYDYVRSCGWWARASYWMDNGIASEGIIDAVRDVIVNGHRTLPEYVDEHDCFSDIESISTGSVTNRADYIKDVTIIRNVYGAVYTFYCFPAEYSDPFGYTSKPDGDEVVSASDVIETAVSWMEDLANDDSHGYDQEDRWGQDYDCSSAVISAWKAAGVETAATYTGDMWGCFTEGGFSDVTDTVDLRTGDGLERGDVLLDMDRHTAMYCGNGMMVEASANEQGSAVGGKPGDQTGREIRIRPYADPGWDCVLRYGSTEPSGSFEMVQYGSLGTAAYLVQVLLRGRGYKGADGKKLARDGDAGENTIAALRSFQTDKGLAPDGICGERTWKYLLWDTTD